MLSILAMLTALATLAGAATAAAGAWPSRVEPGSAELTAAIEAVLPR